MFMHWDNNSRITCLNFTDTTVFFLLPFKCYLCNDIYEKICLYTLTLFSLFTFITIIEVSMSRKQQSVASIQRVIPTQLDVR